MLFQLKNHQTRTLNELIKHNNSFVFWPRQTGKSKLVSAYIEEIVRHNQDQDILFFCDHKNYIDNSKSKLMDDLYYLINKIRKLDLEFVNSNYVTFVPFQSDFGQLLFSLKPSLIVYDEFHISQNMKDTVNFTELAHYMNISNCKSLFISTCIDLNIINALDYKNNYYINIIPVITRDNLRQENNFLNYNYDKLIKELSYKPDELLDFADTNYQRKRKLLKLSKIADGK